MVVNRRTNKGKKNKAARDNLRQFEVHVLVPLVGICQALMNNTSTKREYFVHDSPSGVDRYILHYYSLIETCDLSNMNIVDKV